MISAHVIEVDGIAAGIVLLERGGFRFFAAERRFRSLEGTLFRSVDRASRAARELLRAERALGSEANRAELEAWAPIL